MKIHLLFVLMLVTISSFVTPVDANDKQHTYYSAVILESAGPGSGSVPEDINNAGVVVGDCSNHACIWKNGHIRFIDSKLKSVSSSAIAINDAGLITGDLENNRNEHYACIWQNGKMSILSMPSASKSWASDISSHGQIVGHFSSNNGMRAFLWKQGHVTDLGTLGGRMTLGIAINAKGEVVGSSFIRKHARDLRKIHHAFLWRQGKMLDLGGDQSMAMGINNNGQIVGDSLMSNGETHAFLYADGRMCDIGAPAGFVDSSAFGINGRGEVVGEAYNSSSVRNDMRHAFLWQDGRIYDLNTLIISPKKIVLKSASKINDKGQIICSGTLAGKATAFLLTPVNG